MNQLLKYITARGNWNSKVVALAKNSDRLNPQQPRARFAQQILTSQRLEIQIRLQVYQRARYYDAESGEFASQDPLKYVDGMSFYRGYFVPGGMDPTGLVRICCNCTSGGSNQKITVATIDCKGFASNCCKIACGDSVLKSLFGGGWDGTWYMCPKGPKTGPLNPKPVPTPAIALAPFFKVDAFSGICGTDLHYCITYHKTFRRTALYPGQFADCKSKARAKFNQGLRANNQGATSLACKMLSRCYLLEWQ